MARDARPEPGRPSAFFEARIGAIEGKKALGPVLDLACGRGRHARVLAARGLHVVAVDRNREALAELAEAVRDLPGSVEIVEADLESKTPPPLPEDAFGAVLVFRYLSRERTPWIARLLAPDGLLLYETFTRAQRELGWGPTRDDFLLEPGELRSLFPGLEAIDSEEGLTREPRPAYTARLMARRRATG